MAEMDIYMRRRLVALGGLVAFFIFFVLVVKSCGGDDEPEPVAPPTTGATGETGAALTPDAFIEQADAICGPANLAVSRIDPADTSAAQQEYDITREELKSLQTLELAEPSSDIDKFLADLSSVVDALRAKAKAADVTAADAAQLEIDTAEVAAREQGEKAGFSECGQFLDAGEEPTGGGGGGAGDAVTDTTTDTGGGIAPTDTGTVTPTDPGTTPTDPGTTPPDTGDDGGGGGITP